MVGEEADMDLLEDHLQVVAEESWSAVLVGVEGLAAAEDLVATELVKVMGEVALELGIADL